MQEPYELSTMGSSLESNLERRGAEQSSCGSQNVFEHVRLERQDAYFASHRGPTRWTLVSPARINVEVRHDATVSQPMMLTLELLRRHQLKSDCIVLLTICFVERVALACSGRGLATQQQRSASRDFQRVAVYGCRG